jgi:hypothetical protein
MSGDGTTNPQRGVWLKYAPAVTGPPAIPEAALAGDIEFTDTVIGNMNNTGFRVDGLDSTGATKSGNANINFSGSLTSDIASNGGVPSPIIDINNLGSAGSKINLASTGAPSGSVVPNQILDIGGDGIVIEANDAGPASPDETEINIGSTTLVSSVNTAIAVLDDDSKTRIDTVPNTTASPLFTSGIIKNTDGAAIAIAGGSPDFTYFGTILNEPPAGIGLGYITQIGGVSNATISISGPGNTPLDGQGDGVFINNVSGATTVNMVGLDLTGTGSTGILVQNATVDAPTRQVLHGIEFHQRLNRWCHWTKCARYSA